MQKIGELAKWSLLRDGESVKFELDKPRPVRIRVNSPGELLLHLTYIYPFAKDETQFLSRTIGLDTVEFYVEGAFSLMAEGSGYIQTADGQAVHTHHTDDRVFARIVERKARNYQLELTMALAQQNAEKRLRKMEEEIVARATARAEETAAAEAAAAATAEPKARKKAGSAEAVSAADKAAASGDGGAD